jgi:hypothetical protein
VRAPIAPVMTSNDFVILPLMFKDAMRSEVGAIGYFNASTWVICLVKRIYQALGRLADETSDPTTLVSDE